MQRTEPVYRIANASADRRKLRAVQAGSGESFVGAPFRAAVVLNPKVPGW
jgi:hypothetical protein